MKKKLVALSALMAFIASPLIATPANAASAGFALPEGQSMYAISCDNGSAGDVPSDQLFSVAENGSITTIGSGTAGLDSSGCAGGGSFDPTNGNLYYVGQDWTGEPASVLTRMNTTTGVATKVAAVKLTGSDQQIQAIAINSSGSAYATDQSNLYSLNLGTGALTLIAAFSSISPSAMAFDVNDNLWVGKSKKFYRVNLSDATILEEADYAAKGVSNYIVSMAFDSNNILWFQDNTSLKAANLIGAGSASLQGAITQPAYPSYNFYVSALMVRPVSTDDPVAGNSKQLSVYFAAESSTLTKDAQQKIRKAIRSLPDGADVRRVTIRGFVSGFAERPALAQARAKSVKAYFAKIGVTARYVVKSTAKGLGANPLNRKATIQIKYATES